MAKLKKKGTSGQVKNYITRSAAVRKLQISLPDFRRLCIFKGIYPREPRNKKKASKHSTPSTTFYYAKDIQYLLHEPLLAKFRDHKALEKKISRALGKGQVNDAARLERTQKPRLKLDHIIKERYPTFVDALRDLDDCLSMLFLFANLPSTSAVPAKTIALCQRLCLEFEHYLIVSHSLRRSFLSIKGIYYGADIQGQEILWLVPYKFVQQVSGDIDFRIMGTFVEFYTTLLAFVNYRLYTQIGLIYPPKFSAASDEQGGELGAYTLEGRAIDSGAAEEDEESPVEQVKAITSNPEATAKAQAVADSLETSTTQAEADAEPSNETQIDTFESIDPTSDSLAQPTHSKQTASRLFANHTFYLSRETPRAPLELLLKAFGCKRVGWDAILGDGAFTTDELDPRITHQVVDKPPVGISTEQQDGENNQTQKRGRVDGRIYIQPQWIWDSVNAGKLQKTDNYVPGATLPPHLSPWVKPKKGEYDPTVPLEKDEMEEEEEREEQASIVEGVDSVKALGDLNGEDREEEEEDDSDFDEDNVEGFGELDVEEAEDDDANGVPVNKLKADDDFDGFGSDQEDNDPSSTQYQRELEAEAAGLPAPRENKPTKAQKAQKAKQRAQKELDEQRQRQKLMMSKRSRKLYEKMQYSNDRKSDEVERLTSKRRKIEKEKKKSAR